MLKTVKILCIVAMLSTLAACASLTANRGQMLSGQAEKNARLSLRTWKITGKLAVIAPQGAASMNLFWQETPTDYRILLSAPLGVQGATITGNLQGVQVKLVNGQVFTANSADQLVRQQLGYDLPITALRYWIKGMPMPSSPVTHVRQSQGRLQAFQQTGWHIEYLGYVAHAGLQLPSRITLTADRMKAKLIIYQWA